MMPTLNVRRVVLRNRKVIVILDHVYERAWDAR